MAGVPIACVVHSLLRAAYTHSWALHRISRLNEAWQYADAVMLHFSSHESDACNLDVLHVSVKLLAALTLHLQAYATMSSEDVDRYDVDRML